MLFPVLATTVIRAPLIPLQQMYPPRAACVWSAPKHKPVHFTSENEPSSDGQFLIQRNRFPGFSEVIIYSYSAENKELSRVQITNAGDAAIATSPGIKDGAWTFSNVPQKFAPHPFSIVLRPTASGWTYHAPGVPGSGVCTKD